MGQDVDAAERAFSRAEATVSTVQRGVDTAQKGVDSAQSLVDFYSAQVISQHQHTGLQIVCRPLVYMLITVFCFSSLAVHAYTSWRWNLYVD